jgi:hypothetical protein
LRILEIGGDTLFARGVPEQTTFVWTSAKPNPSGVRALGPVQWVRRLLDLRAGKYDLLVVHSMQYAPWHPRSWGTALRDWNVRAPLGLFALFAWRFVHLFHRVPIAVVDLGDSFGIGRHNFFLLEASRFYFKRELPADHWHVFYKTGHRDMPSTRWRDHLFAQRWISKLKPLSYGSFLAQSLGLEAGYEPAEKTSDIFFVGQVESNHTARVAGMEELKALEAEGYVIDRPKERMPGEEFARRLSAAWIAWSPAGLGWDCARHYEAALVETVPLINYPTILRDEPLKEGEHCLFYALEPGGLAQAARGALADKGRLRRMGKAAAAHVRRHHSWRARAERVAVISLGRKLDGQDASEPPAQTVISRSALPTPLFSK